MRFARRYAIDENAWLTAQGRFLDEHDNHVQLHFEDDGVAFDPRQPMVARVEALPHSDSGGRGLVLLRSVAERIDYERTPQQRNHLRVTVAAGPNH